MRIEWGEAELQRHIHPSGGYTKHSKVYQLLIDELQRMGNGERLGLGSGSGSGSGLGLGLGTQP